MSAAKKRKSIFCSTVRSETEVSVGSGLWGDTPRFASSTTSLSVNGHADARGSMKDQRGPVKEGWKGKKITDRGCLRQRIGDKSPGGRSLTQ